MSKSEDPFDATVTVVKAGTCETLSGKSKLTYHIGRDPEDEIHVRIHKNTGNGFFSPEWVSLKDIEKAFAKVPSGKPVTAIVLNGIFKGKSVNTPGFLLAVLVHEKLLMPLPGRKRSHEAVDPGEFREKVDSLGSAEGKQKGPTRKTAQRTSPAARKKAAIKKKAISRKKTVRGS
jgi:hypothetical protein